MNTTRITDNLIQINRLHFVNAYLVREEDGFTLVDTTLGGAADGLIATAREAGGEIRRIALTHGHGDHVGSLDALRERLGTGVEVLLGELDARILAGEVRALTIADVLKFCLKNEARREAEDAFLLPEQRARTGTLPSATEGEAGSGREDRGRLCGI